MKKILRNYRYYVLLLFGMFSIYRNYGSTCRGTAYALLGIYPYFLKGYRFYRYVCF